VRLTGEIAQDILDDGGHGRSGGVKWGLEWKRIVGWSLRRCDAAAM
jgi:hypothetical protein